MSHIAYDKEGNKHTLSLGFSREYFEEWAKKRGYSLTKPASTTTTTNPYLQKKGESITAYAKRISEMNKEKAKVEEKAPSTKKKDVNPYIQKKEEPITDYVKRINEMNKKKAETEAKEKREAEARAKREAEAKAKREAEARAKREAEAKAKREAEEKEKLSSDWLAEDEMFQQLNPDRQSYIRAYYDILSQNEKENQERLKEALEVAKSQADPYFAEQLNIAQSELLIALGEQKEDFASKQRDLQLRIDQIKEDLKTGKERLTVDQQAELARREREYEYQLESLREDAAARGLTFSTQRALAESRQATEQADIVESTKRSFQREVEDLQTRAARGETEAQNLLEDYERAYGENVGQLVRGAETTLGTAGLPSLPELPGVKPLGGVTGTMEETKTRDILARAEALAGLRSPFEL
jgi:hypothetical protein